MKKYTIGRFFSITAIVFVKKEETGNIKKTKSVEVYKCRSRRERKSVFKKDIIHTIDPSGLATYINSTLL